ncbi:MAG TPA: 2-C-methyl-D-erythritol 2,4-cyclodiphosphate synthase [Dissulfurispiraceae bacterium]|nr:2-C-methyl-D-erythritol 2,4-cyclodiphosphate synthase [Dissulfurispiraceae bacterium]
MRIGIGYDSHRFAEGRKLVLGGVEIPFDRGLLGHSDGDALCHAITDAIIGALGKGDIGKHFPDSDNKWKNASSVLMLKQILDLSSSEGFEIAWIDSVIITERPKLADYIDGMKQALSQAGVPSGRISIKAKTNERMGFAGREEGLAAQAVCLLVPKEK